jgi:hypothetical protein
LSPSPHLKKKTDPVSKTSYFPAFKIPNE